MPVSPLDNLPQSYGVAVHDAGAANMIAAWVDAARTPPARVLAEGPARAIWAQRFGEDAICGRDPEAIDGLAALVSGTGWASDFEHRARLAAARQSVRSVAVIDHWVNYAMRFEREGVVQLPDIIWVGDEEAQRIARSTFPDCAVSLQPNLYLAQQVRAAGPVPDDGDALFLLEPARSDWGRALAGEFQALDFFMAQRAAAGVPQGAGIRIRPHPSDPPGKYAEWMARHPRTRLDRSPDMASALQAARWVAGMNSAGLVIALAAGREVICALPPHAPRCVLPHTGIRTLVEG